MKVDQKNYANKTTVENHENIKRKKHLRLFFKGDCQQVTLTFLMKDPFYRPREPDRDDCNGAGGDDGGDAGGDDGGGRGLECAVLCQGVKHSRRPGTTHTTLDDDDEEEQEDEDEDNGLG